MTLQDDGYNCGVYVVYILSQLITNNKIDPSVDGDELRQYYQMLFTDRGISSFSAVTSTYEHYSKIFGITESEDSKLKRARGEYNDQKRRYSKKEWDAVLKQRLTDGNANKKTHNTEQQYEDDLNRALMASIQEEETQKKLSEIPEVREILDAILDRVQVVMFLEENKEHIGTQNENKQRVEEELRKNIDELNVLEQQVQSIEPLQEAVDLINLKG